MIGYRKANSKDYKSFAQIHMQAFKGFFLSTLGFSFLCTYYFSCLKSKRTIAICAYTPDEKIIGFASGSLISKGYHKNIFFSSFFRFGISLIKVVFSRPHSILRLINNLDKNNTVEDKGDYSELLSIAILPDYKGKGIGKNMLSVFEQEVFTRDGNRIALTTDFFNNESVIEFYEKSGYETFYHFTTYPNRRMVKLIKTIKTQ